MNKIKNFDLSIVVPFYKRTKFAQSIVKSLDNQNDELNLNIEVIFIDSDIITLLMYTYCIFTYADRN